jgi:AP-2 complex subunit alpha
MNNSAEPTRNVQHNNAQHAVLFEAIGLAIHLDSSSPLVGTAAVLLARFISSKETNVRYLGLDTMAHLAARADSLDPIKRHQSTIILSLRDKDISVRRRALDLLYSMCDVDNSELIVGELLRYLRVADYALREEMVLKIAILTEKYANSYKWYVDTILQLISAAGDHVGDEVWYRVVQIVTNTEDLQQYAARVVFEHLKAPSTHESLVKVGGILNKHFSKHGASFYFQVIFLANTVISSQTIRDIVRSNSFKSCIRSPSSVSPLLDRFYFPRTSNG